MTHIVKKYKIKLPFTVDEWRKGQRYALVKLSNDDMTILTHKQNVNDLYKITETHKVLNLKKKMPTIIKKLIPEQACFVDEYSITIEKTNNKKIEHLKINEEAHIDEGVIKEVKIQENIFKAINHCISDPKSLEHLENLKSTKLPTLKSSGGSTLYLNKYFDKNTFILTVDTLIDSEDKKNIFNIEKKYQSENIDFRTFKQANIFKIGDRNYEEDWESKYPAIYLYKKIDVNINSFLLGRVAYEVESTLIGIIVDAIQLVIREYDNWKNLTEEQLVEMESELLKKYIADSIK